MEIKSLRGAIEFLENLESYKPENELEAAVIQGIYERRLETNADSMDVMLELQKQNNEVHDQIIPSKDNTEVIFETSMPEVERKDGDKPKEYTIDFAKLAEIGKEYKEAKKLKEEGFDPSMYEEAF